MLGRLRFYDGGNKAIAPSYYGPDPAHLAAFFGVLRGHSLGGTSVVRYTEQSSITQAPTSGTYQSVYTVAELVFTNSTNGGRGQVLIPAPNSNIFLPDLETVDPSTIGDLIASAAANLYLPTGDALDTYVSGSRRRVFNW